MGNYLDYTCIRHTYIIRCCTLKINNVSRRNRDFECNVTLYDLSSLGQRTMRWCCESLKRQDQEKLSLGIGLATKMVLAQLSPNKTLDSESKKDFNSRLKYKFWIKKRV